MPSLPNSEDKLLKRKFLSVAVFVGNSEWDAESFHENLIMNIES
jgi:hypothetical protein